MRKREREIKQDADIISRRKVRSLRAREERNTRGRRERSVRIFGNGSLDCKSRGYVKGVAKETIVS